MAYKTGSDTNAGIVQGSTYGTAVEVATGDKLELESIESSRSVTVGESNGIGSGKSIKTTSDALATDNGVTLSQQARYDDNGLLFILALFFGASAAPVEQNVGEGDYLHVISWLSLSSADKFATVAYEATTTKVIEYPTAYVTSISIESGDTPGYLTYTANFVANKTEIASTVNTNATLQASTVLGSSIVTHNTTDTFYMNAQSGGALSGSDTKESCVSSISINFDRPKSINEGFGCSKVLIDDMFVSSITLNFNTLEGFEDFTNHYDEVEQKAKWSISGAQIGAGDNKNISFYFPRLKAVQSPEYSVSDAGANGYSVTYDVLEADSAPTGMDFAQPYIEATNENSGTILA